MTDKRTIDFYDQANFEYAEKFASSAPDRHLQAFMAMLPNNSFVLDLGCGPGFASGHMMKAGHRCDAVDASAGMVQVAREAIGVEARQLTFDDLDMVDLYDGVWANFSLLHAPRPSLPRHLSAIATALKADGAFHIGMKVGTGQARDQIDRLYTFVTEAELTDLLTDAGFSLEHTDHGEDVGMAGTLDKWIVIRARNSKDG